MNRDLDYFTEFLTDSSAYSLNEFFRMVREWYVYIQNHKDEFNYLADDDWKEIRERLIADFQNREDEMEAVDEEWEEICEITDKLEDLYGWELIKFLTRRMEFLKKYQYYLNCPDEDIAFLEKHIPELIESFRDAELADLHVRLSKLRYDEAIARFDETLVSYYERTGKFLPITSLPEKKKYNGN